MFAIIVYGYVFMMGVILTLLAAVAIYCYFKTQTVQLENDDASTGEVRGRTGSLAINMSRNTVEKAMQMQDIGFLAEISKFQ